MSKRRSRPCAAAGGAHSTSTPSDARAARSVWSHATSASTAASAPRGLHLDRAVGQIPHPAASAQAARLVRRSAARKPTPCTRPRTTGPHRASRLDPELGRPGAPPAAPRRAGAGEHVDRPGASRRAPGRPSAGAARTRTAPSGPAAGRQQPAPVGRDVGPPDARPARRRPSVAASSAPTRKIGGACRPLARRRRRTPSSRSGGRRMAAPLASGSARPIAEARRIEPRRRSRPMRASCQRRQASADRWPAARRAARVGCGPIAAAARRVARQHPQRVAGRARTPRRSSTLSRISGRDAAARRRPARWPRGTRSSSTTWLPASVAIASSLPSGERSAATMLRVADRRRERARRAARRVQRRAWCRAARRRSARTTASTGARAAAASASTGCRRPSSSR